MSYIYIHNADVDECLTPTCLNGGDCKNTFGGFKCTCKPGFKGVNCQTGIQYQFSVGSVH